MRLACHGRLALLLAFSLWTGLAGVDFGYHWDEHRITDSVAATIRTGRPLPGWYNYPSVIFDVALLAVAPHIVRSSVSSEGAVTAAAAAESEAYHLRLRAVLLCLGLLAGVWVYLLMLRWRSSPLEALLASAILLSSFEFAYHARWIAPDVVMMQFAALTTLAIVYPTTAAQSQARWLAAAAIAAGLTAGTKYPGAIVLVGVIGAVLAIGSQGRVGVTAGAAESLAEGLPDESAASTATLPATKPMTRLLARSASQIATVLLLFSLAYLATTPGTLLQSSRFVEDLLFEAHHYAAGHGGHTVVPGWDHATRLGTYLALVMPSRHGSIALLLSFAALVGAWIAVSNDRRLAVTILLAPLLYALYLCAQRVLIVRNSLLLFPFMACLAAIGICEAVRALPRPWLRAAASGLVTAAILVNLAELRTSAASVESRAKIDHAVALAEYMEEHQDRMFWPSSGVRALLGAFPAAPTASIAVSQAEADALILWTGDIRSWADWPANTLGRYEVISGPSDVNFDYYPSWSGDRRLVAVDMATAERFGLVR
jgi:hypothetical protein